MNKQKSKRSTLIIALAAALGYGSWAVFANFEHGTHAWLMAGIVQAVYAFISTLSITHVARWTFIRYKCGIKGIITGFGMSFVVMLAIPLSVHNFFGTPDIWQTILPGLIWGSIYLLGFLITLDMSHRTSTTPTPKL
ncbi:MAG: hypothetical protein ACRBCK_10835 [Alphaproteobacteria bacterium]